MGLARLSDELKSAGSRIAASVSERWLLQRRSGNPTSSMEKAMQLIRASAFFALVAGFAPPASAQDRSVESCTTVKALPAGGFAFEMRPDINVRASTSRPGPFELARPQNVIGITCLRESLVPQALDIEVLQAGFTFAISDVASEGLTVIQLELRDGRVIWETLTGRVSPRDRVLIDGVVARMNATSRF